MENEFKFFLYKNKKKNLCVCINVLVHKPIKASGCGGWVGLESNKILCFLIVFPFSLITTCYCYVLCFISFGMKWQELTYKVMLMEWMFPR